MEEFPLSIVEENPPSCAALAPTAPGPDAILAAMRPTEQFSPQWLQVFAAMEELRHTLDQNQLLKAHPAVAHDFMAVLAALESLRGDALFESYWRAQLDRLNKRHPKMKAAPDAVIVGLGATSVYAHQSPDRTSGCRPPTPTEA